MHHIIGNYLLLLSWILIDTVYHEYLCTQSDKVF